MWRKFQGHTAPKRTRRECPKLRIVEDRKKNRGKSRAGRRDLTTASRRPERKAVAPVLDPDLQDTNRRRSF